MELLKEFIIAVGGGATALIALLTVFKSMFIKFFEKGMDAVFEKNLEKYKNKLTRSTSAYEILLNKEFDFYTKVDPLLAELIVLIQDLVYYAETNSEQQKKEYKENLLRFLELIKEMKNEVLLHQAYIPSDIFSACTGVVSNMQDGLEEWHLVGDILFEISKGEIDLPKIYGIRDMILKQIAYSEMLIKKRLTDLSKIE